MAARLLLLLCVGAVLCGAGAGDAYAGLSGSYRSSVDLALEQLNSHSVVVHHFRYLRSLEQKTTELDADDAEPKFDERECQDEYSEMHMPEPRWIHSPVPEPTSGDAWVRSSVDLALEQLNSHSVVVHPFSRYPDGAWMHEKQPKAGFGVSYHYHHFYLKPTRCPKGTVEPNPGSCAFRNDRPLMDCVVCYKTIQDVIEASPSPYVHCIQKPRLTQDMRSTRTDHCTKMTYHSGAPTLLAVRTK
ncbi:unnamed protein product [Tetraodon nigroviridis]|uniref:Retinoic acid receptor responder protein 2 n=1 Tax=Tetraodon nigroviridis TaxID=99883 RepID=Q4RMY0_TETNG|nr:unnamed protein product [Tetraodon nigroviridis]